MPNELLSKLDSLLSSGRFVAAEEYLLEQLAVYEHQREENHPVYLTLLNEIASLYRGLSRYSEAEQYFLRLQDSLEHLGNIQTLEYATLQINLAGCYRLSGKPGLALEHYASAQRVLTDLQNASLAVQISREDPQQDPLQDPQQDLQQDIQKNSQKNERLAYLRASVLNNISLLYCDLGNFQEALEHANEAVAMLKKGVGDSHELATSYNNLANIYLRLKNYPQARNYCNEALAIYAAMPKENVHHAAALVTFAKLCYQDAKREDALAALDQAERLTAHFFGQNHEYWEIQNLRKKFGDYSDPPRHCAQGRSPQSL